MAPATFDRSVLERMVQRELPASVLRCRGMVYLSEAPGHASALRIVGRRTSLIELDIQTGGDSTSEIVAIGRGLDGAELTRPFDSCLSSTPTDLPGRTALS